VYSIIGRYQLGSTVKTTGLALIADPDLARDFAEWRSTKCPAIHYIVMTLDNHEVVATFKDGRSIAGDFATICGQGTAPEPADTPDDPLACVHRLRWLCGELAAGNEFSADTLRKWEAQAHAILRGAGRV
jgi:hypothetical protein